MAAGSSRRFGSDKRLYRQCDSGETLLQQTLKSVLSLELETVVVLRTEDEVNASALLGGYLADEAISVCYAEEPQRGLGHSIAQFFSTPPAWAGALLFLGDMPRVQSETIKHLLNAFSASPQHIHAPAYENQRGHPVLFPQRFFPALAQLSGDVGAKALLQREQASVKEHVVNDAGVVWDLDEMPARL